MLPCTHKNLFQASLYIFICRSITTLLPPETELIESDMLDKLDKFQLKFLRKYGKL